MEIQQDIAFKFGESLVGYELDAMIDSKIEEGVFEGRTYADAPEIDGTIYVTGDELEVGQMVPVEIVESRDYDLVGEYLSNETIDQE
jgi:ribosomal protein S12 methylthiotransferase